MNERLAAVWQPLATGLEAGDIPAAQSDGISRALSEGAAEIAYLEGALRKLPGAAVRSEVYGLLAEYEQPGAQSPPVILVPEDQDLDEDGFLALPIAQVSAPLSWPRLALGLAAAAEHSRSAADPAPVRWDGKSLPDLQATMRWDAQASAWFGPAYLFSLVERAVGSAGLVADLLRRIGAVRDDLDRRGLLAVEGKAIVSDIGALPAASGAENQHPSGPVFGGADLAAAEVAASRLADGVLASARPTLDRETTRQARERLLLNPEGGPAEVYEALAGLREEPLSGAQILTGGWLARERARLAWLKAAIEAGDVFRAYAPEVLQLDSLVLKSLETASVHRRLVAKG
ncbi:MAG: hypothetical protein FJZ00_02505 [Candidatus Sericytochromatia bacterium]|uniref:Uncharacterized protein n=1 Tax=Candidatus Tanganyikabacteria bacterium TaxID=2961651 RepID=A0A937X395_9BACT|nr:hypothetical protein [Candidatus Tanganyikabacteria bacterium]